MGAWGRMLFDRAQGIDAREVVTEREAKSESAEQTFPEDSLDKDFLKRRLFAHAERVGTRIRAENKAARTVTLKVKYADFRQITRSRTLPGRTCSTEGIFAVACELLDALELEAPVRLIGLGVSRFEEAPQQLRLAFDTAPGQEEKRREQLDQAVDGIRARFGKQALVRGRLFGPGK
jgi:DNA polymerase-4